VSRLDDLRELREGILDRMVDCESDQNYASLGRLLSDVVKQIEELDPSSKPMPAGGAASGGGGVVVDFTSRLANGGGAGS